MYLNNCFSYQVRISKSQLILRGVKSSQNCIRSKKHKSMNVFDEKIPYSNKMVNLGTFESEKCSQHCDVSICFCVIDEELPKNEHFDHLS